jgi:segregation and condensation protein A
MWFGGVALRAMAIDVTTPIYEGPFDLLLQLILKEQVDLYEIDLSIIVDAYLRELEHLQSVDLNVATEFLLIAATLVELKTRRLLPGSSDMDLDEEFALWEERDLLLARLIECKTFKDVALIFNNLSDVADLSFARTVGPDERFAGLMPDLLEGTSVRRLQTAAIRALTPKLEPIVDLYHVNPVRFTVAEAVARLVQELPSIGRTSFRKLTADMGERLEVIVRFLAVLELYKQGYVELDQIERFGDIEVTWTGDDDTSIDEILIDAYEG